MARDRPKLRRKGGKTPLRESPLLSRRAPDLLLMTVQAFQVCPLRTLSPLTRSYNSLCPHRRPPHYPIPPSLPPASAPEQGVQLHCRHHPCTTACSRSALSSAAAWYASALPTALSLQIFRPRHGFPLPPSSSLLNPPTSFLWSIYSLASATRSTLPPPSQLSLSRWWPCASYTQNS